MKVLVINSGSSSLKYQLLNMETEAVMATGLVERIGETMGAVKHEANPDTDAEKKVSREEAVPDHKTAMHMVVDMITDAEVGVIASTSEIDAVGHRVLQGGEDFTKPCVVTPEIKDAIRANIPIGPLHNPANLMGIEVAEELFENVPQVAVFDTEFHQTMPKKAFLYPLPYEMYTELRVRRYGFHGTSHKYITKQAAKQLGKAKDDVNLITIHLGNGCSMAAVKNGRCVDTTMGLTPLEGLMMGTRSGDIDPSICAYVAEQKGMTPKEIDNMLNKQSGLKGVCGLNDMRDIHSAVDKGNEQARLALDMFVYRIKKYVGAFAAVVGNLDAIVFTAGIGENDDIVRQEVCEGLEGLGIVIDTERNAGRVKKAKAIGSDDGRVAIWVIPTNEELEIAQESLEVLGK